VGEDVDACEEEDGGRKTGAGGGTDAWTASGSGDDGTKGSAGGSDAADNTDSVSEHSDSLAPAASYPGNDGSAPQGET